MTIYPKYVNDKYHQVTLLFRMETFPHSHIPKNYAKSSQLEFQIGGWKRPYSKMFLNTNISGGYLDKVIINGLMMIKLKI